MFDEYDAHHLSPYYMSESKVHANGKAVAVFVSTTLLRHAEVWI
jgi:hypothetical protein